MKEKNQIDIRTPRQAVYRSFEDKPGACPACGGELLQSMQTYMVATRQGKRLADSFMLGSDFGWFCRSCPLVVINTAEVGKMLSFGKARWKIGSEFLVLGIVDLDAVPTDKRRLPIGAPGNPIPLIEFSNLAASERPNARKTQPRSKRRK